MGNDHGNIVVASPMVGEADHDPASFPVGRRFQHDLCNLVILQLPGKSVTAEDEDVILAERDRVDLDADGRMRSERLEDHIPIGVGLGLLLGNLPRVNQLLDQRLVLGDADDLSLPQEIPTTVPNLGKIGLTLVARDGGKGRPEPFVEGVVQSFLVNQSIGLLHGHAEPLAEGQTRVDRVSLQLQHPVPNGLDRQSRRDLPGECPAHPIRDREQRAVGPFLISAPLLRRLLIQCRPAFSRREIEDQKVVFVARPHQANIGLGKKGKDDRGGITHHD